MRRTRVVHLTSAHRPFDTRIFHKECKTLAAAGYHVTLIAPHERDERRDGVMVKGVRKPRGRFERMTRTVGAVYRAAVREDAEIYHFHDPELMPVGLALRLKGKRVVYDVHENYTKTLRSKFWIPAPLRVASSVATGLCEQLVATACTRVIAAVPGIAARFSEEKTSVIYNFPEVSFADSQRDFRPYAQRENRIVYVGMMSVERGCRAMVDVVGSIPAELRCRLTLVGDIAPALLQQLEYSAGWPRVDALGHQSRAEVKNVLDGARAGLCVLHPTPNHVDSYPVKLFEYMAAGLPVVASDFPQWREVVNASRCGLLVNPLNTQEITQAVRWILEHPREAEQMGKRGQRAVAEIYNWECQAAQLLAMYRDLESKWHGDAQYRASKETAVGNAPGAASRDRREP
jgi:glycosyltransferase involved in cell wall biosynthesis